MMAVSTVHPTSFAHNPPKLFEASVKAHPHFSQPMTQLPRNILENLFESENGKMDKESSSTYNKHERMEFGKSSFANDPKTSYSDVLQNEETRGNSLPQRNQKVASEIVSQEACKNLKEKNKSISYDSIPKYVKCFSCERIIKEDHFSEHLIFGPVKCSDCNVAINDCQSFQIWATELSLGEVSCHHSLSYCLDPAEYLSKKLSGNQPDNLTEMAKVTTFFENYINKLDSLLERKPWRAAIEECRDYLLTRKSSALQSDISSVTKEPDKKRIKIGGLTSGKYSKSFFNSKFNLPRQDKETKLIKGHGATLSSIKNKRSAVKRTQSVKNQNSVPKNDKQGTSRGYKVPHSTDLEFVAVPKDGFYYVMQRPVDECPNCYELLCPSWATVNVNSFLITVICRGCNLTIYIPSPQIEIITDENMVLDTPRKPEVKKSKSKPKPLGPQSFLRR